MLNDISTERIIKALDVALLIWEHMERHGGYKWQAIAALKKAGRLTDNDVSDSWDCPLCDLFFKFECQGCPWPSYSSTNREMVRCEAAESPYEQWRQLRHRNRFMGILDNTNEREAAGRVVELLKQAKLALEKGAKECLKKYFPKFWNLIYPCLSLYLLFFF